MAPSKKADKNTTSKSKTVEKAITRPSSTNRPRHNGRFVAATSSLRNTDSDPDKDSWRAYIQGFHILEGKVAQLGRDERPHQYRVHKSYTRRHRRHHYSSASESDSQEEDGPTKSSQLREMEIGSHHAAELGCDAPQSWYSQTDLSREVARALWWGLDAETQDIYAVVAKTYSTDCLMSEIKPPFPATVKSLANWLSDLDSKRASFTMIKTLLYGVSLLNVDLGYGDSAFDSPQLARILAGFRRLRGVS